MSFDMKELSEYLKKNIELVKNNSKKLKLSNEQLIEMGEETIKEMCLPPLLEQLMLSKNREWFSGEAENTKNNDKGEKNIDSLGRRLVFIEERLCLLEKEIRKLGRVMSNHDD